MATSHNGLEAAEPVPFSMEGPIGHDQRDGAALRGPGFREDAERRRQRFEYRVKTELEAEARPLERGHRKTIEHVRDAVAASIESSQDALIGKLSAPKARQTLTEQTRIQTRVGLAAEHERIAQDFATNGNRREGEIRAYAYLAGDARSIKKAGAIRTFFNRVGKSFVDHDAEKIRLGSLPGLVLSLPKSIYRGVRDAAGLGEDLYLISNADNRNPLAMGREVGAGMIADWKKEAERIEMLKLKAVAQHSGEGPVELPAELVHLNSAGIVAREDLDRVNDTLGRIKVRTLLDTELANRGTATEQARELIEQATKKHRTTSAWADAEQMGNLETETIAAIKAVLGEKVDEATLKAEIEKTFDRIFANPNERGGFWKSMAKVGKAANWSRLLSKPILDYPVLNRIPGLKSIPYLRKLALSDITTLVGLSSSLVLIGAVAGIAVSAPAVMTAIAGTGVFMGIRAIGAIASAQTEIVRNRGLFSSYGKTIRQAAELSSSLESNQAQDNRDKEKTKKTAQQLAKKLRLAVQAHPEDVELNMAFEQITRVILRLDSDAAAEAAPGNRQAVWKAKLDSQRGITTKDWWTIGVENNLSGAAITSIAAARAWITWQLTDLQFEMANGIVEQGIASVANTDSSTSTQPVSLRDRVMQQVNDARQIGQYVFSADYAGNIREMLDERIQANLGVVDQVAEASQYVQTVLSDPFEMQSILLRVNSSAITSADNLVAKLPTGEVVRQQVEEVTVGSRQVGEQIAERAAFLVDEAVKGAANMWDSVVGKDETASGGEPTAEEDDSFRTQRTGIDLLDSQIFSIEDWTNASDDIGAIVDMKIAGNAPNQVIEIREIAGTSDHYDMNLISEVPNLDPSSDGVLQAHVLRGMHHEFGLNFQISSTTTRVSVPAGDDVVATIQNAVVRDYLSMAAEDESGQQSMFLDVVPQGDGSVDVIHRVYDVEFSPVFTPDPSLSPSTPSDDGARIAPADLDISPTVVDDDWDPAAKTLTFDMYGVSPLHTDAGGFTVEEVPSLVNRIVTELQVEYANSSNALLGETPAQRALADGIDRTPFLLDIVDKSLSTGFDFENPQHWAALERVLTAKIAGQFSDATLADFPGAAGVSRLVVNNVDESFWTAIAVEIDALSEPVAPVEAAPAEAAPAEATAVTEPRLNAGAFDHTVAPDESLSVIAKAMAEKVGADPDKLQEALLAATQESAKKIDDSGAFAVTKFADGKDFWLHPGDKITVTVGEDGTVTITIDRNWAETNHKSDAYTDGTEISATIQLKEEDISADAEAGEGPAEGAAAAQPEAPAGESDAAVAADASTATDTAASTDAAQVMSENGYILAPNAFFDNDRDTAEGTLGQVVAEMGGSAVSADAGVAGDHLAHIGDLFVANSTDAKQYVSGMSTHLHYDVQTAQEFGGILGEVATTDNYMFANVSTSDAMSAEINDRTLTAIVQGQEQSNLYTYSKDGQTVLFGDDLTLDQVNKLMEAAGLEQRISRHTVMLWNQERDVANNDLITVAVDLAAHKLDLTMWVKANGEPAFVVTIGGEDSRVCNNPVDFITYVEKTYVAPPVVVPPVVTPPEETITGGKMMDWGSTDATLGDGDIIVGTGGQLTDTGAYRGHEYRMQLNLNGGVYVGHVNSVGDGPQNISAMLQALPVGQVAHLVVDTDPDNRVTTGNTWVQDGTERDVSVNVRVVNAEGVVERHVIKMDFSGPEADITSDPGTEALYGASFQKMADGRVYINVGGQWMRLANTIETGGQPTLIVENQLEPETPPPDDEEKPEPEPIVGTPEDGQEDPNAVDDGQEDGDDVADGQDPNPPIEGDPGNGDGGDGSEDGNWDPAPSTP